MKMERLRRLYMRPAAEVDTPLKVGPLWRPAAWLEIRIGVCQLECRSRRSDPKVNSTVA